MATFAQWRAAADKGEVRRITYVCGEQAVLVEEVIATTRAILAEHPLDYTTFTAGDDPEPAIWASVHQYRISNRAGLIVIRHAECLKRWQSLNTWASNLRAMPGAHLLFAASEPDFPTSDGKRTLQPHLELIKTKGRIVRCAMPNEDDAVNWVRRRAPMLSIPTARHLLTRAGGSLITAANVAAKLALFTGFSIDRATIDKILDEQPAREFTDAVLHGDKRAAVALVPTLDRAERSRVIALLDSRLDLLGQLCNAVRAGQSLRDVTGVNPYLARLYFGIAKDYHPQRCAYLRRVLAVVDDAHRTGADDGVMEALVALF